MYCSLIYDVFFCTWLFRAIHVFGGQHCPSSTEQLSYATIITQPVTPYGTPLVAEIASRSIRCELNRVAYLCPVSYVLRLFLLPAADYLLHPVIEYVYTKYSFLLNLG